MDKHGEEFLDVVKDQDGVRNMPEDEIASMVQSIANRLRGVESRAEGYHVQGEQQPKVAPKKASR